MYANNRISEANHDRSPPVTLEQYREPIMVLLALARTDSGGARYAAQALLSLYDGASWKADLAGVCCCLDDSYFRHVLVCMAARAHLMRELHEVIEDDCQKFDQLGHMWSYLKEVRA